MKKFLALALVTLVFGSVHGAYMQTYKSPKSGDVISSQYAGRIASVDVFSTEETGSVELKRVFQAPFYTNLYHTTSTVSTNVVDNPDTVDQMVWNSVVYTNVGSQVESLREWYVSKNDVRDELYYALGGSKWIYKHGSPSDADYVSGEVAGTTSDTHLDMGSGIVFDRETVITAHHYTTNVVTTVTTNGVSKIKAYDLVVTNVIFSGSCSNNCFHSTPTPDVWIFKDDKILFSGTATGGEVRLVLE